MEDVLAAGEKKAWPTCGACRKDVWEWWAHGRDGRSRPLEEAVGPGDGGLLTAELTAKMEYFCKFMALGRSSAKQKIAVPCAWHGLNLEGAICTTICGCRPSCERWLRPSVWPARPRRVNDVWWELPIRWLCEWRCSLRRFEWSSRNALCTCRPVIIVCRSWPVYSFVLVGWMLAVWLVISWTRVLFSFLHSIWKVFKQGLYSIHYFTWKTSQPQ